MRYRNPHTYTAVLPAHVDGAGRIHDAVAVEPGQELDWPIPIASFEPVAPERTAAAAKKTTATAISGADRAAANSEADGGLGVRA